MLPVNILKIYQNTCLMLKHNALSCHYLTLFMLFFPTGALSGQKSSGLSGDTGALVGLSFLLLFLLLVLVKMYKNHQRVKTCSSESCENYRNSKTHLTHVLKRFTGNAWFGSGEKRKDKDNSMGLFQFPNFLQLGIIVFVSS